ncbi:MAG: hypothetical protein K8R69_01885 [Deltaproteobacteria bacterium]|nr:hypothetical protein [Deltaproteobacteria bacterium]
MPGKFAASWELAAEAAAQTIQPESSATPPATPKKKSKGAEAVKKPSSETHDLEPSGDLALRLRAAADEEARRRGGGMAHYEGFELTTSISVENLTVTVDPIAGTGTVTMNGETKTFALGKGEGSVAVDLKTGKISHSVGVNVGGNSIVLDRDGFSFSAEGVGMKMGYDLSVQSTTFKPTVSVGPFQIQGDKGRLDVGASLKLEGGPVSVEAKAVAHYSVDGEKVDVVVQDTIDAAVKKVNGKGLFEPLRQIFP